MRLQYTPFLKISEENILERAEFVIMAIFRDTGVLARDHLLQFRLALSPQCDGHCCIAHLCVVGGGLTVSDPGAGPPVWGANHNLQCPAAQRPCLSGTLDLGGVPFFQSRSTITA